MMIILIVGLMGLALGEAIMIDIGNAENKIKVIRKVGDGNE
jgi:hypothetical protein